MSDSPMEKYDEVVEGARAAIEYLEELTSLLIDIKSDDVARLLKKIREILEVLRRVDAVFCRHLLHHGNYGLTEIEGLGLVEVKRTADRKAWDHDGWKAAARAALLEQFKIKGELVDSETGEFIDKLALLTEAMNIAGSVAPRLTALRELGIDPGDYCETSQGNPSVNFKSG